MRISDWSSDVCSSDLAVKKHLMPIADSICRTLFTVGAQPYHPPKRVAYRGEIRSAPRQQSLKAAKTNDAAPRRRGPKSRPIVEFPTPLWEADTSRMAFADALRPEMQRHGHKSASLHTPITSETHPA